MGELPQRCRGLSWEKARELYAASLEGLSVEYGSFAERLEGQALSAFRGGDEHINFQFVEDANDETRIYKLTHSDQFGCRVLFDPNDVELTGRNFIAQGNDCPWFYLKRWQLLNQISHYETRFEGVIYAEREQWLPRLCVSQPYVAGGVPREKAIEQAFLKFDYFRVGDGAFFNREKGVLLSDAYPRNVRIWNGEPIPFDAIASEPKDAMLEWILAKLARKN